MRTTAGPPSVALGSFGRKRKPSQHTAAHLAKIQITWDIEATRRPDGKGWDWVVADPDSMQASLIDSRDLFAPDENKPRELVMAQFGVHLRKRLRKIYGGVLRALNQKRSKMGRPTKYNDLPAVLEILKQQGITNPGARDISPLYKISESTARQVLIRYRSRSKKESSETPKSSNEKA